MSGKYIFLGVEISAEENQYIENFIIPKLQKNGKWIPSKNDILHCILEEAKNK